jgi:type II secretory ATPase GspE/PulE/Tfp pilus assembly ATPase PilB-like protein
MRDGVISQGTELRTHLEEFQSTGHVGHELIRLAIDMRATDIHLDPQPDAIQVRFRIDGQMEPIVRLPRDTGHLVLNQWKISAGLNIADPFRPQEGRLDAAGLLDGYDARLTTALLHGGETAALRLLNRSQLVRPLGELGFSTRCLAQMSVLTEHGEGLVLITGPTGVGKTTTLYSLIHALDRRPG